MTITTTITPITDYAGGVPDKTTQNQAVFSQNASDWTDYQANELVPDVNTSISLINNVTDEINSTATTINNNAVSASSSAAIALAVANFKGVWASLTGSLSIPSSVEHNNDVYMLLVDLADVTQNEPNLTNDWIIIDNSKKINANKIFALAGMVM